jgi:hypothetical protein
MKFSLWKFIAKEQKFASCTSLDIPINPSEDDDSYHMNYEFNPPKQLIVFQQESFYENLSSDCKKIVEDKDIVVLNSTNGNQVLFVCKTCLAKPKAPQTEKKEEAKSKIAGLFEVLNGGGKE